jgi:guanosine-3',5'-bis(diphosphate) 3'-pyrophosphohydrolase
MSELVTKAIDWMILGHRSIDQRRKTSGELYEVHPLDVVRRLKEAGEDEATQAGGAVHDIFEDVTEHNPEFSVENGRLILGDEAIELALEVTDVYIKKNYPNLNRKERHKLENERISKISTRGKSIKLADIASNCTGIAESGWDFGLTYVREKLSMIHILKDGNPILFKEAIRVLNDASEKYNETKTVY